MGGERMAKRSSLGSLVRKRLSDITNTQSQPKPSNQEEKPQQISPDPQDYINQLIQEKMALMKVIEEKNRIIVLSGTELQNLRTCVQKLQLQNWNLAQSNSQLSAELNFGRDMVRTLQHELVGKDALLKAKSLEKKATEECTANANANDKPCIRNTRRNATMATSITSRRGADKDKAENKRRCLRRRSARFKSLETEAIRSENLFEIDDLSFVPTRLLDTPMHEDNPIPFLTTELATQKLKRDVQMGGHYQYAKQLRECNHTKKFHLISKCGEKTEPLIITNIPISREVFQISSLQPMY